MTRGKRVERVEPGSIAEELDIGPGDTVITINGENPADILDWRLAESSEDVLLAVKHENGELVEYEIEKDFDEPLGIGFASPTLDDIRSCQNRCVFCFVDQMPPEMRSTLYIKDDDYRLSFLSGSYITLTNLRDADLARIEQLRLSPLYVSVHTTDSNLRRRMMNHKRAGEILPTLKRLTAAGIEFHTQIVLCPGFNDGEALDQTISDLYHLFPGVKSLAVVPVGLTGHRENLYPLSPFDEQHAQNVLKQVARWQERCLQEQGTRFVFAADEFYNMANLDVPQDSWYEDYPQLENGVGLVRLLGNTWEHWRNRLPHKVTSARNVVVVTGLSAARYLQPIMDRLNEIDGIHIDLQPIQNRFFGGHVTVTGLLTGQDIIAGLIHTTAEQIYLPAVMLKEGRELFLDGYTVNDVSQKLNADVRVVKDLDNFLTDLL